MIRCTLYYLITGPTTANLNARPILPLH